jgi:hypothetical protein
MQQAVSAIPVRVQTNQNSTGSLPFFDHVIIIMMENTGRPNITGNKDMPFINKLINEEMYADHYHGYTNPSLPNYIAITAGSQFWSFSDNPAQVRSIYHFIKCEGHIAFKIGIPTHKYSGSTGRAWHDLEELCTVYPHRWFLGTLLPKQL